MGYVNSRSSPPTVTLDHAINQRGPQLERAVREYLAFRCNMQEIFTYPWIDDLYIEASGVDTSDMLELSTPPAPEERRLRSTLVPGLLGAVVTNLRYFSDFRIFELTQVLPRQELPQRQLRGRASARDGAPPRSGLRRKRPRARCSARRRACSNTCTARCRWSRSASSRMTSRRGPTTSSGSTSRAAAK